MNYQDIINGLQNDQIVKLKYDKVNQEFNNKVEFYGDHIDLYVVKKDDKVYYLRYFKGISNFTLYNENYEKIIHVNTLLLSMKGVQFNDRSDNLFVYKKHIIDSCNKLPSMEEGFNRIYNILMTPPEIIKKNYEQYLEDTSISGNFVVKKPNEANQPIFGNGVVIGSNFQDLKDRDIAEECSSLIDEISQMKGKFNPQEEKQRVDEYRANMLEVNAKINENKQTIEQKQKEILALQNENKRAECSINHSVNGLKNQYIELRAIKENLMQEKKLAEEQRLKGERENKNNASFTPGQRAVLKNMCYTFQNHLNKKTGDAFQTLKKHQSQYLEQKNSSLNNSQQY
ncbi:coiled-coil domain-containing protein [Candidatus Deianiraea vastatrix]|uniref:Uncharacterized protein n=1 Tax=Candidatus Deianiraea vastatrix TaxID=2163644 RepID=A0A5B8XG68_9RICK|nr:hypothetical protein [Candidatus Deianiraea vastatrix]QED23231.1 hypothetical protein Deia_00430 [Candidatus Deianiraea vastatrix]